jgi:putative toxin-antitoxin system antitoxin component (TIGR02293 family)
MADTLDPVPSSLRTDAEWASVVEEGLPIVDFVRFGRESGYTVEELARLVHIPARTYARRVAAKARLDIPEGERAVRIMRLYDRAKAFFGTHENTREWLNSRLPALGGRTPLDMARTEPGAREVENIIGRIEHGLFS